MSPEPSVRHDLRIIERMTEHHRRRIVLSDDREWLTDIDAHPARLLQRMEADGLLEQVGRGQYVTSAKSAGAEVGGELLVDMLAGASGRPYYLGYRTALDSHGLAEMDEAGFVVGIPEQHPLGRHKTLQLSDGTPVTMVRHRTPWPDDVERIRAMAGTMEYCYRSSLSRTLVDVMDRPDYAGGPETAFRAWRRAYADASDGLLGRVVEHAQALGDSAARRASYLLHRLGAVELAATCLLPVKRTSDTVLLVKPSVELSATSQSVRDRETGVVVNLPADELSEWLA